MRYHALTAETIYHRMQVGLFNPGDRPYGLGRLLDLSKSLLAAILPDEWSSAATSIGGFSLSVRLLHIIRAVFVVWLLVPLGLWLWRGPRRVWPLVAPLFIGVALMWIETVVERMLLISPRYVYPLVPPFGLACGLTLALWRRGHEADARPRAQRRAAPALTAALTVALAATWLYMTVAVSPFYNSGRPVHLPSSTSRAAVQFRVPAQVYAAVEPGVLKSDFW